MRSVLTRLIVLAGLLAAGGCSTSKDVEFQVVDAASLRPLEGVRLNHFDDGPGADSERESRHPYGPTGPTGVLTVPLKRGYSHVLDLEKEDYQRTSATIRPELREVGITAPAASDDSGTARQVPLRGRVILPMYRVPPD